MSDEVMTQIQGSLTSIGKKAKAIDGVGDRLDQIEEKARKLEILASRLVAVFVR